jgi:hypothetical protein
MLTYALLTKRSKPILALSLVKPLRILLPRTRFLRHRIWVVSSSLGPDPPGLAHILLPCAGPYLRFGFGPIIRLQLRLEPLFLPIGPTAERVRVSANLHGSLSHCAFVSRPVPSDNGVDQSAAFVAPLLQGQPLRRMTLKALPIPSGGAFPCPTVRSCRPPGKFCRPLRRQSLNLLAFFPARHLHRTS